MPENNPAISVIVPVYNVELYLRQCLESILAQEFDDWEAILVDDGSTDGSGAVCDEYATRDSRFGVVHQVNRGLAEARNSGIEVSVGEYVFFLDSDDWLSTSCLSKLYSAIINNGCQMAVGRMTIEYVGFSRNDKSRFPTRTFDSVEFASLLCKDREFHNYMWNKLYHRDLITKSALDIRYFEDIAHTIAWVLKASKVIYVSECIGYHYRQRKSSILGTKDRIKALDYFEAVKIRLRQFLEYRENLTPELAANCLFGMERAMMSIARRRLVADKRDMTEREIAKMIEELANNASSLFSLTIKNGLCLGLKKLFGLRLAKFSPKLFIVWARMSCKFHRHKSAEHKLFD